MQVAGSSPEDGFLPDFCRAAMLARVAVLAQMFALLIALVSPVLPFARGRFGSLLLLSLFVQWIAIASAGTLCLARAHLNRLSPVRAFLGAWGLLLTVTWVVGEMALLLLWVSGATETPAPAWNAYYQVQNLSVAAIVSAIALAYFRARHELCAQADAIGRARAAAIRLRLRPHFLYNALNTIAALTRQDPRRAETAIEDMSDLVRTMLAEDDHLVPLKNEIAVAQKYLGVESLRLEERLRVEWDIGKTARHTVLPVLCLQPLLEDAIQHGVEPLPEGGVLTVRISETDGRLHMTVRSPARHDPPRSSRGTDPHRAVSQLRERLQHHYGERMTFAVNEQPGYFETSVVIPTRGGNT